MNDKVQHRYLIVLDSKTERIVYEGIFLDTESTYLAELSFQNKISEYEYQWTGEIFKNKPSVIFGFLGYSFGCPSIEFLDKTEPPIVISCDNRH